MKSSAYIVLVILWMLDLKTFAKPPILELTKLYCEGLDDSLLMFKKCNLTKGAAGEAIVNVHIHPLQILDKMKMRIKMLRKIGKTYRPYYFETTVDVCDFLKDFRHQIPWGLIYERTVKYSNINHSCPYEHDVILKDYSPPVINVILPIPKGGYAIFVTMLANKLPKATLQLLFTKNV